MDAFIKPIFIHGADYAIQVGLFPSSFLTLQGLVACTSNFVLNWKYSLRFSHLYALLFVEISKKEEKWSVPFFGSIETSGSFVPRPQHTFVKCKRDVLHRRRKICKSRGAHIIAHFIEGTGFALLGKIWTLRGHTMHPLYPQVLHHSCDILRRPLQLLSACCWCILVWVSLQWPWRDSLKHERYSLNKRHKN